MGTFFDRESLNHWWCTGIQSSNPELLDELSPKFTEYNYTPRNWFAMFVSKNLQLSTKTNASNNQTPVTLLDLTFVGCGGSHARCDFSGNSTKINFVITLGAKAIKIADGRVSNYFLTTFGRLRGKLFVPVKCDGTVCLRHCTFKRRHHQQPDKTGSCGYLPKGKKPDQIIASSIPLLFAQTAWGRESKLISTLDKSNSGRPKMFFGRYLIRKNLFSITDRFHWESPSSF